MKHIKDLYELCDIISDEVAEATAKVHAAGGMTAGDLEYIDKLTHTLKSLKTTIAMIDAEEDDGWSYDDGMPDDGRSMARDGRTYRGGMRYSRADNRGRGSQAQRDRMGRYSSRGYSRAEGVKEMLRNAMNEAQTDREREAIRKALDEMER